MSKSGLAYGFDFNDITGGDNFNYNVYEKEVRFSKKEPKIMYYTTDEKNWNYEIRKHEDSRSSLSDIFTLDAFKIEQTNPVFDGLIKFDTYNKNNLVKSWIEQVRTMMKNDEDINEFMFDKETQIRNLLKANIDLDKKDLSLLFNLTQGYQPRARVHVRNILSDEDFDDFENYEYEDYEDEDEDEQKQKEQKDENTTIMNSSIFDDNNRILSKDLFSDNSYTRGIEIFASENQDRIPVDSNGNTGISGRKGKNSLFWFENRNGIKQWTSLATLKKDTRSFYINKYNLEIVFQE